MKGLIISVLLAGNLAFGQNFFEQYDEGEYPVESQTFFQETTYQDYNQETGFDFFNRAYEYSEPDIGLDAGNPGDPVPIDGGIWVLLASAMGIGCFFLYRSGWMSG